MTISTRCAMETVISKEDIKTDENDDFFVTLESATQLENRAVRGSCFEKDLTTVYSDLFAANSTYEKIEKNGKVSVPFNSAVVQEKECNAGSSLTAKQVSLLETNENVFGSSSSESSNFKIGTSGTYGWEVDPSSRMSRSYRTLQHAFEMGELGEETKPDSATSQENGLTLLSTSALKEEENTSSSVPYSNTHPVSSGMHITEGDRNTLDDHIKPDSAIDDDNEPSTKPNSSTAEDYEPSKRVVCEKSSVANEITRPGDRHRTKCSFCDKRFRSNWHRHRHETIHTGQKSYECPVCKKYFSRRDKCQLHQRTHTDDDNKLDSATDEDYEPSTKPDSSPAADYEPSKRVVYGKSSVADEIRRAEDRHRTKCSFCDKRFRSNWHRHRHETIHTGQKSYECPVCKKCFSRPDTFQLHQRTHTDERPYICCTCGQCFKFQSSLCKHEYLHTVTTVGPVPQYLAKDGLL